MVKAVKLLQEDSDAMGEREEEVAEEQDGNTVVIEEAEAGLLERRQQTILPDSDGVSETSNGGVEETESDDHITDLPALNELELDFDNDWLRTNSSDEISALPALRGVRCAAHTVQLAVNDALKQSHVSQTISKARNVSKKLRTQNMIAIMKKMKLKKPRVDCLTRWHSTVDMLSRLLELKEFCNNMAAANKDLHLSVVEWETLEKIVGALTPAKILTKNLQSEDLTAGDFFKYWMKCKLETTKVGTNLSRLVVEHMERRQTSLFTNEALLSALFLDARVQILLTTEQKKQAKLHLALLWEKINELDVTASFNRANSQPVEHPILNPGVILDGEMEDCDELELLLQSKDINQDQDQPTVHIPSITHLLNAFEDFPRLKQQEDVLQFWQKSKTSMPELYKLSKVALALPVTQVSVERLFSGLKFILSRLRSSMKADVLEDVLIVRTNILFSKE